MLKRAIKYTDFDGNPGEDTEYFNLTKSEIVELEVETKEGLAETLARIVKIEDRTALIAEFKRLILAAYGRKSPDGKRFIKSDELRTEFSQTAAYDALFIELATDIDAAATFLKGILPSDVAAEAERIEKAQMPLAPPTLPAQFTQS